MITSLDVQLTFNKGKLKYCSDKNWPTAEKSLLNLLESLQQAKFIESAASLHSAILRGEKLERVFDFSIAFVRVDKRRLGYGFESTLELLQALLSFQTDYEESYLIHHTITAYKSIKGKARKKSFLNLKLKIVSK